MLIMFDREFDLHKYKRIPNHTHTGSNKVILVVYLDLR